MIFFTSLSARKLCLAPQYRAIICCYHFSETVLSLTLTICSGFSLAIKAQMEGASEKIANLEVHQQSTLETKSSTVCSMLNS